MTPQHIYIPLKEQGFDVSEFIENGMTIRVAVQSRGVAIETVGPCPDGVVCERQGVVSRSDLTGAIAEIERFQKLSREGPFKHHIQLSSIRTRKGDYVNDYVDGKISLIVSRDGCENLLAILRDAKRSL